jgi:membrane protein
MSNLIEEQSQRVLHWAQAIETRVRTLPGANTLIDTAQAYSEDRCSLIAAGLSYYALLSLFPLALFILAVASQFGQADAATRAVTRFIASYMPTGALMMRNALEEVTRLRGALTLAGAVGFFWSASGVFDAMQLGVNRAFRVQNLRPMWRRRLFSLVMVFGAGVLFVLSFAMTTFLRLAVQYRIIERHTLLTDTIPVVGGLLSGAIVFGLLYRYMPYDSSVRWRGVWLGALIAGVLWEIAKLGFAWYLANFALLSMVYGSVGAVIAVMLWSYLSAAILLIGAEFAAVMTGARRREKTGKEWWAIISP